MFQTSTQYPAGASTTRAEYNPSWSKIGCADYACMIECLLDVLRFERGREE